MKITKGLILALLMVACSTFSAKAQKVIETVYLKNGSIISGIIIEEVPGQSLKIRTNDGNIFVCELSGVSKITRDFASRKNNSLITSSDPLPGYKGFVDLGYSVGTGNYRVNRLEFTTSHGYQFSPYFYMGAGAGVSYYHEPEFVSFPLFANPRLTIPTDQGFLPFVDLKIGYTVGEDIKGFYLSPSLGTRIALNNKLNNALNISVGYTLQSVKFDYYNESFHENFGAITFKLGYEF